MQLHAIDLDTLEADFLSTLLQQWDASDAPTAETWCRDQCDRSKCK